MIVAKRGELALCGLLPFAAGLAIGDILPKRNRLDITAIVAAPFFSVAAVGVLVIAACTYGAIAEPRDHITSPYIIQGIAGAVFILPGIFIGGAIPAIIGAAISGTLKLVTIPKISD